MRFELFLPPGHSAARTWPTLLVMDPRGRGLQSLRLFAEAAGRLGWVVLSSYNTSSDNDRAPNERAVNAMLTDARKRYGADPQRIYLAGFSGTARVAWVFASQLKGAVRGVIAAGAGLTGFAPLTTLADTGDAAIAFLSSVGDADYNWSEIKATDAFLTKVGTPHRTWEFEGAHSWPPANIASAQLEWFEARAMRTGYALPNDAFLDARRARLLADADSLLLRERPLAARRALREIAADAQRDPGGESDIADRLADLEATEEYKTARAVDSLLVEQEASAIEDVSIVLTRIRLQSKLPSPAELAAELKIPELQKMAATGARRYGFSARRQLDRIAGLLIDYEPESYLETKDVTRARLMLETGAFINAVRAQRAAEAAGIILGRR